MSNAERHPLGFFLPEGARLLILGSFPPPRTRWSMDFFYPNFQNDMWRVMGLVFYGNKDCFVEAPGRFSPEPVKTFCRERGIALGDAVQEAVRKKGNASDKFLETVTPIDLGSVLGQIPRCQAIAATGEKALHTLLSVLPPMQAPPVGDFRPLTFEGRNLKLYRMPSTSRAYPAPLTRKADIYRRMFEDLGML